MVILLLSFSVSAYKLLCLTYGQSIPSKENPRYTCWHDQCINICVTDNLYPTNPGFCYKMNACEILGGPELDVAAPNLTINSPKQNFIYNSRGVLFDITSNEPYSLYYTDNINGRGRWSRLASNIQSYSRKISFKDGLNNITIKATDRNGNPVEYQLQFYVDSKKPKIKKTEPRKGFIASPFEVQFSEENPKKLVLHYGNLLTGYRQKQLDISNDCYIDRKRYYCSTEVPLEDYDEQKIEYWFILTDIANNTDESRHVWLEVDTTFPVLNNPSSFWTQGEGRYSRYIYFTFDITEKNFDEITYADYTDRIPKERRLCSRLKDGICEKKLSFRKGHHIIDIQITDDAGNAISTPRIEFDVSY